MLELRVPPAIVWLVCAVLMGLASRLASSLSISIPAPLTAGFIVLCVLSGCGLAWLALNAFYQAQTTTHPMHPDQASALVTDGIYRYTRNPMYLGMTLLLLAWALYLANWAALLGVALFMAYITRFQIIPEERALQRIFGEEYEAYRRSVRRWV